MSGTGGIVNVGFTCYANSVFQAFRHCNNIYELFQEKNYKKMLKDGCKYNNMTEQFANLVQTLGKISSSSSIRPSGFWHSFDSVVEGSCFEHLSTRQPHDAHEFLMFLLDGIHESLSKNVNMRITDCNIISEKQKCQQKSLEAWKTQFEKQYSPFVDLFFGIFHIEIICQRCNNVSYKFDTFNTLKGVFNDTSYPTIIQSLEADINKENLEYYQCDKCKPNKTNAIKITRIWKLPSNLIIVFKRFTYDGRKINTPIQLGNLDLESLFSDISPYKKSSKFILNSCVDHHGSIHGGHYTAQAKNKEHDKWFLYDDQNVHSLENPMIGENSYILFLEKI
jgi:ubiquitin carboxyl-terminal hydrolase 8